jgi:hypothetical protein
VREHDVTTLTADELRRIKRDLQANLGLIRPDSPVRGPIMAQLNACDTELYEQANAEPVRPVHSA